MYSAMYRGRSLLDRVLLTISRSPPVSQLQAKSHYRTSTLAEKRTTTRRRLGRNPASPTELTTLWPRPAAYCSISKPLYGCGLSKMGGHKKRLFDKRNSTTYRLVRESSEYGGTGKGTLVPIDELRDGHASWMGGMGMDSGMPMPPELAHGFFGGLIEQSELTDEERREIVALGLPDDGYNYLRHLSVNGAKKATLEQIPEEGAKEETADSVPGGISADFQPPTEDKKVVNARGLIVRKAAQNEEEADDPLCSGATRAFSREVQSIKGQVAKEVREMEELLEEFETHAEGPGSEGEGDLQDDFVLDATNDVSSTTYLGDARLRDGPQQFAMPECLSEEHEDDIVDIDIMSRRDQSLASKGFGDLENRSVFSERWVGTCASDLEGRRERNEQLQLLDERFENMLLEYDDDELGDLEERAHQIQGNMDIQQFDSQLKSFMETAKANHFRELIPESKAVALDERDDEVINRTRALDKAAAEGKGRRVGREEWEDVLVAVRGGSDRLDCESAWSYRTKTSTYQPSRIGVVANPKKSAPAEIKDGVVKLSTKSGLPVEVLKNHHSSTSNFQEASDQPPQSDGEDSTFEIVTERPKGETLAEKKERKALVKEARRQARANKKELKTMFKQEMVKQQKQMAGLPHKNASTVLL